MDELGDEFLEVEWSALVAVAESDWNALDERIDEAAALLGRGSARSAYDTAVWILERDEEYVPALRIAALASSQLLNKKQARAAVDRALALDNFDWRTHMCNAWILLDEKKRKQASEEAVFALHFAESDPHAYSQAAAINSLIGGKKQVAEACAQKALELDPRMIEPRLTLARLAAVYGDADASIEILREALQDSPGNERALAMLAQIQASSGKRSASAQTYEELAAVAPGSTHLSEPGKDLSSPATALGCMGNAYVMAWVTLMSFLFSAYLRPVGLLAALTAAPLILAAIKPVRRWVAIRWKPRKMAAAPSREFWFQRNPDLVFLFSLSAAFGTLLLVAIFANP